MVLARRDFPTSYHLSVVTDDALQGITHVVRGQDLQLATSIHRLLQTLLDLPAPAYFHHRLITGAGRSKALEEQPRHRPEGVAAGRHEPRRNKKNGRLVRMVRRGSGRPSPAPPG